MRCNSLDEHTILLSLFGNRALYLMCACGLYVNIATTFHMCATQHYWTEVGLPNDKSNIALHAVLFL